MKLPSLAAGSLLVVLVGTGGAAAALEPARVRAGTPPALLGAPRLVPQLPPPALGPAVPAAARLRCPHPSWRSAAALLLQGRQL